MEHVREDQKFCFAYLLQAFDRYYSMSDPRRHEHLDGYIHWWFRSLGPRVPLPRIKWKKNGLRMRIPRLRKGWKSRVRELIESMKQIGSEELGYIGWRLQLCVTFPPLHDCMLEWSEDGGFDEEFAQLCGFDVYQ